MPRIDCRTNCLESAWDAKTGQQGKKFGDAIKKEVENSGEQVFHRKSERRRMARDIFLVFEEQPNSRRSRGSNKRKARPARSKFSHLKVEEPHKTKGGLLRDIKNEPKCYLSETCLTKSQKTVEKDFQNMSHIGTSDNPIARVNPIFLWVKQDDTRIVEVRCEDYDKRNRIRIKKTTNGWRAIPRTDPSSSKIVKFFQTPLLKVKHEVYENRTPEQSNDIISKLDELTKEPQEDTDFSAVQKQENVNNCIKQKESKNLKAKRRVKKSSKNKSKIRNKLSVACSTWDNGIHYADALEAELNNEKQEEAIMYSDLKIRDNLKESENIARISEEEIPSFALNSIEFTETYQQDQIESIQEMQLCPRTGLFLPNLCDANGSEGSSSSITKSLLEDIEEDCQRGNSRSNLDDVIEDFDAETKNLKDLIDDADLLQHCGDNANSGAELIDSLVKRSCENNFIQENQTLKGNNSTIETFNIGSKDCSLTHKDTIVDIIPSIIEEISDPPKCLSFNEAGEIEGLNEELFQSNNFIDTFQKQNVVEEIEINSKRSSPIDIYSTDKESLLSETIAKDVPKDLSYKRREEVCPPSESRNQCIVTSSSDIIKSPRDNDIPSIESTSETIKNLILEQFMKLNAINSVPTQSSNKPQQQSEPMNLGKQLETTNDLRNYVPTTNYIETVVIDDDNSNDEPMKKRVCNIKSNTNSKNISAEDKSSIIDKDPDPLTQLQLLIRNTQWKVPDPILVPKDRLSAVLASPAREIPLLITTRPELRLPEAFAYPEIIQNPNILVISMAQLEAILKNEVEMEKNKSMVSITECQTENIIKLNDDNVTTDFLIEPKVIQPKEISTKCSHVESSLASDINAATLAVLNQMLLLPYFGQLSQEFIKSFKDPVGIQNKFSNILPVFNHHQLGLQHLDELYKSYLKQITKTKSLIADTSPNRQTSNYNSTLGTFQHPVELAILQKIIQNQMCNFFNMNPTSSSSDTLPQKEQHQADKNTSSEQSPELNSAQYSSLEQIRFRKTLPEERNVSDLNKISLEKSTCLRNVKNSCEDTQQKQQEQNDSKPRLTCKSLSNLLEPENMTSTIVPLVNHASDSVKNTYEFYKQTDNKSINKEKNYLSNNSEIMCRNLVKANKTVSMASSFESQQQRKRNISFLDSDTVETGARNSETINMDSNPALWHPLFGSNPKTGYSSPWQWTTVTATGE